MENSVSVIVPNFNRVDQLRCCLHSILHQSHSVLEVIIIDDFSEELVYHKILKVIEEFRAEGLNIVVDRNFRNLGANFSRNRGIDLAQGDFIAFIDSDDAWLPQKLEIQLKAIEDRSNKTSSFILSATGRYRVDENGSIVCIQSSLKKLSLSSILSSNFIGSLSSVLVHREALLAVGGFDEQLGAGQDWDLYIRLCEKVDFVNVPDPLLIYVDHQGQRITLNSRKRLQSHLRIYARHIRPYGVHELDIHKIYEIFAEDYQGLGNKNRTEHFLALSLANSFPFRVLGKLLYYPIRIWLCCFGAQDIRMKRYERYAKLLRRQKYKDIEYFNETQYKIMKILNSDSRV